MSYNLLTGYLTYFFVNVFNIDARIVSTMLFIEGIWDAINDPVMGSIIDKTRTRFGKLRPYLLGVPVPLAVTTILLFAGPLLIGGYAPTDYRKVIYMTVTYFAWEFMYTIGDVPFWGLSAALSPNPDDRSKAITSARFISSIVGGIPTLALPIIIDLVSRGMINSNLRIVFFGFSLLTSILGMSLFSMSGLFIKERVMQSDVPPSLLESLKGIWQNKPLRILIFKDILSALGGIGGVFGTYYLVDVLGTASISLVTGIPGTVIGFASYMVIPLFKKHLNNKQIIITSKLISAATGVLKFIICLGGKNYTKLKFMIPVMMIEGSIGGIMNGVNSVVPTELVGETVDYSEWTSNRRTEGSSFSVLTFVGKFNGAMARSIGTFLIPFVGYQTSNNTAFVKQSAATKEHIFAMNSIVPALLGSIGIIPMLFYDLVGSKREKMYSELELRRAARAQELRQETAAE